MPSETLNRTEDLINKIGYPDGETDEAELQSVLERAHNSMQGNVGKYFIEDKRVRVQAHSDGEIVNEFDLKFSPILEIGEILLNEHELIDESNYSVNKEEGKVTIDQSFADEHLFKGQIVRFKEKPIQFKNIELYKAVALAKNQEIIQLEDSEQNALYKNAEKLYRQEVNKVNRRTGPGNATDGDIRRGTK